MVRVGLILGPGSCRVGGGAAPSNPDFVSTWNVASDGEVVTLPLESAGVYSGTIDWGDGGATSTLSYANRQHTYATAGTYTITISGDTLQGWAFKNTGDKLKITDVSNWGTIFEFDRQRMFQGCSNMDVSATDIPTISTTNFTSNFYNTGITNPDWSGWDMSAVTNYSLCFMLSSNFNGNIGNWVTGVTTNISSMLNSCSSFNQDLSGWNTSAVTNAENLLSAATSFNSSVANWVLNGTWFRPFNGASAFTGIGVEKWDTSGLTSGQNMFVNCTSFNGDTSGWNTSSLLNAQNMFYNCSSYDQDMSSWDINQVTNFLSFCFGVTLSTANYDALLIAWDAQGAMSYSGTVNFGTSQYSCKADTARTSLITKWGGITDGGLNTSINCDFVSTWDTTQAGSASDTVVLPLLSGGTYSGTIDWGDGSTSALSYANRTHVYAAGGTYTITISGSDIQGWNFDGTTDYLKITDISNWGNLTITSGYRAFRNCSNLDVTATDAPTLLGTQCHYMFQNCTSLTTPDLSKWDVSGMTYTVGMFAGCRLFNGNVITWDVSNVTEFGTLFANSGMFWDARAFNQDISGWNVSSGTSFGNMFYNCDVFNQPIGNWTTSSATNMYGLIRLCAAFDQSVGGLDITTVSDLRDFATGITISTANYDDTLIQWEAQLQAAYPSGVGYPYTIATNFGSSQYTLGGAAEAARTSLISTFGWTITDGGGV